MFQVKQRQDGWTPSGRQACPETRTDFEDAWLKG